MRRKGTGMYCFTCKEDFESMMTCIYRVWEAKKGSQNVRLEIEPVEQMEPSDGICPCGGGSGAGTQGGSINYEPKYLQKPIIRSIWRL